MTPDPETKDKDKKPLITDDRLISGVIGYATGSAIIGGLLGGDIIGGVIGDALEGDGLWD